MDINKMMRNPMIVAGMIAGGVYLGLETFRPALIYDESQNKYIDYVNPSSVSIAAGVGAYMILRKRSEGLRFRGLLDGMGGNTMDATSAFHEIPPDGNLIAPLPPVPGLPVDTVHI